MSSGGIGSGAVGGNDAGYGIAGVALAAGGGGATVAQQGQGLAALLVMLAVLCFIFAYCCWGAPFCRSLCRRHCVRRCCCRGHGGDSEDGDSESGFEAAARAFHRAPGSAAAAGSSSAERAMLASTPTIILLPHGRMLVVDGTIFSQLQAESTGLDLVELGESVMRAQRNAGVSRQLQNSQGSIIEMDAETPSKDSMGSLGCFPPPTYESIYGKEQADMPPSYSDILLHRFAELPFEIELQEYGRLSGKEEIEMSGLDNFPRIIGNPASGPTMAYPQSGVANAMTGCYSSQSLPRNSCMRSPSVISNPLDSYYIDNELSGFCRDQRRRSATATRTTTTTAASRARRSSCNSAELVAEPVTGRPEDGNIHQLCRSNERHSRTDREDRQFDSENAMDNRHTQQGGEQDDPTLRSQNNNTKMGNNDRRNQINEDFDELSTANSVQSISRQTRDSVQDRDSITIYRESRILTDQIPLDLNNPVVSCVSEEEMTGSCSNRHNNECDEIGDEDDLNNFETLADIRESRV